MDDGGDSAVLKQEEKSRVCEAWQGRYLVDNYWAKILQPSKFATKKAQSRLSFLAGGSFFKAFRIGMNVIASRRMTKSVLQQWPEK